MQNDIITIYTDGACKGNPGLGAWAATLEYQQHKKEIAGIVENTTNNQMELTAVIEALSCIKHPGSVVLLYTDSQYVQLGITEWIHGWKRRQWKKVKNIDLWQKLDNLASQHNITWKWVEGHAGNPGNEYVDMLCNIEIKKFINSR